MTTVNPKTGRAEVRFFPLAANIPVWWNGIHDTLKKCWPKGLKGSNPFTGTKIPKSV